MSADMGHPSHLARDASHHLSETNATAFWLAPPSFLANTIAKMTNQILQKYATSAIGI